MIVPKQIQFYLFKLLLIIFVTKPNGWITVSFVAGGGHDASGSVLYFRLLLITG
jgi:hypothetical protein